MTEEQKKVIESKSKEKKEKTHELSKIDYYKKNVYGNEMNYLHDADIAKHVKTLTGQSTVHQRHLDAFAALGHEVRHIPKN